MATRDVSLQGHAVPCRWGVHGVFALWKHAPASKRAAGGMWADGECGIVHSTTFTLGTLTRRQVLPKQRKGICITTFDHGLLLQVSLIG